MNALDKVKQLRVLDQNIATMTMVIDVLDERHRDYSRAKEAIEKLVYISNNEKHKIEAQLSTINVEEDDENGR